MSNFDQLKKDLYFHERRLGLLLRQHFGDNIRLVLNEVLDNRAACKKECEGIMTAMDHSVVDAKMRGVWNDIKIVREFDVDLDLPHLVGAPAFRAPDPMEERAVVELVKRVVDAAKTIPDIVGVGVLTRADAEKSIFGVEQALRGVKWEDTEVSTLKEAMSSHVTLLEDLSNVMKQLQIMNFHRSKLRAQKDKLKMKELEMAEKGEISLMDGVIQEVLEVNDELMKLDMEKVVCVERAYEDNLARHRSNLNKWKVGAAMLETCYNGRVRKRDLCEKDRAKIQRGIEYMSQSYQKQCAHHAAHKQKTAKQLQEYSNQQDQLRAKLFQLHDEMVAVEGQLEELATHRWDALNSHVEVLEKEAQDRADYEEFILFTSAHMQYLKATRNECDEGMKALDTLKKFLLNDLSYEEYDFHEIAKKVKEMMRRAVTDMQKTFHEHIEDSEQKKEKLRLRLQSIADHINTSEMELELCRETLDPNAKKHTIAIKELNDVKATIQDEINALDKTISVHEEICKQKIDIVAPAFASLTDETRQFVELKALNRSDERMDRKSEMISPPEDAILQERARIETSFQHTAIIASDDIKIAEMKANKVKQLRREVAAVRQPGMILPSAAAPPTMHATKNSSTHQMNKRNPSPQQEGRDDGSSSGSGSGQPPPSEMEKLLSYRDKAPRTIQPKTGS